jgi:hypothetical protein
MDRVKETKNNNQKKTMEREFNFKIITKKKK